MRSAAALCVLLAAVSTDAAVAQKLGSILPDRAAEQTERNISGFDRARQTMNAYAACLVHTRLLAVRKAMAKPTEDASNEAIAQLSSDECLQTGDLRMPSQLLRGAVYRALYIRDVAGSSRVAVKTETVAPATPLQAFGECVNRIDAADVRELILSIPATPGEDKALTALGPTLSRCITPGEQIRFNRALLQSVLAEAAYRQATASNPVNR